ncbi:hypothetical protein E2K93_06585 [Thalassotalea sp. HSM 43]|uniref:outer membrane beta-barrel protein n=1 Tax=Thalassotalea sp. HSM 43 TaxID=2552945 RepID=UPI0010815FCE|nr:outer membrane beta-barrel protein [Thalassotalea sp. HSM 43]QBY04070.1 hypothetical protein E2K93_06585 [Thalassotalea sp. HSM 43]
MNKYIAGIALVTLPFFSNAETTIVSEILVGTTHNNLTTSSHIRGENNKFSNSENSESYGIRLGVKFTDNISIELSRNVHGSVESNFTYTYYTQSPGIPGGGTIPSETQAITADHSFDIESTKLGFKLEYNLWSDLFINTRIGIAYWEYDDSTPHYSHDDGDTGNDVYYSVGADYHITENIYVGLEYSFFEATDNWDDTSGDNLGSFGKFSHEVEDLSLIAGWNF